MMMIMIRLLLPLSFAITTSAFSAGLCDHTDTRFNCVQFVKNYDADTITFNIPGIHSLLGRNISVRVMGIDAPELRTKDQCEKSKSKEAKTLVHKLLKNARRIDLVDVKRGKYFRIVANVIIDGKSLSQQLLDRKLAYSYDGGTKSKINWCQSNEARSISGRKDIQ